jgi:hypothetical protein
MLSVAHAQDSHRIDDAPLLRQSTGRSYLSGPRDLFEYYSRSTISLGNGDFTIAAITSLSVRNARQALAEDGYRSR